MRIVSWNVNGIRACHKKGCFNWFFDNRPDILCLQETKAEFEQYPEELRRINGYHVYSDHSKGRKGYSGVAIFSKIEAEDVIYGLGDKQFDQEGRLIGLKLENFWLFNIYFPNGGGGPDRLKFKLEYYDAFLKFIKKLEKDRPVIFCGDINTAHKEIDLARPKENEKNTGFLPIERKWLDRVVDSGYVDIYRKFYPEKKGAYTYWDMKTFARERNVGWRIDYFFVSEAISELIKSTKIYDSVLGSDHCPIEIEIKKF